MQTGAVHYPKAACYIGMYIYISTCNGAHKVTHSGILPQQQRVSEPICQCGGGGGSTCILHAACICVFMG